MNHYRKYRFRRGFRFIPFILFGLAFFSLLVMALWNALLPPLLGLPSITFLQASGLLILSRILFGGFPGGRRPGHWKSHHWRARMAEKWATMSPEERQKFKAGMKHWCGKGPWEEEEKTEKKTGEEDLV